MTHMTYNSKKALNLAVKFYSMDELPEEFDIWLWYYKGEAKAPFTGCMIQENYPGEDKFYCWRHCPFPSREFRDKHNI
jgi:hypothetical protein